MFQQGHFTETNMVEWKLSRFDHLSLQHFNTAQLQVIVNDQLNQIEGMLIQYFMHLRVKMVLRVQYLNCLLVVCLPWSLHLCW